jgi:LysM repeat protein
MELVKENIEYEGLQEESTVDTIVRDEYVIPDTHPDVYEILMLDAKPKIMKKEILNDKIYLEGQIQYNLLYMTKENDKREVSNVNYSAAFSNYIECDKLTEDTLCEADCYVEHMNCSISNERKVCIEGIIILNCSIYKKYDYDIVKDVSDFQDIQFWKNPTSIDKIVGDVNIDLLGQMHIQIPMEKPQVSKIIKCDVILHKKSVKILEGKIKVNTSALIKVLYKCEEDRNLYLIEEDMILQKEVDMEKADSFMDNYSDFDVCNVDYIIKEDELGENRIVDVELMVKVNSKVMYKEDMEMIEDAYSPSIVLNMDKKEYTMNVMHNHVNDEIVVKGDLELEEGMPKPKKIIMSKGDLCITDKKLVEDKVIVDGVLKAVVIYNTVDDEKYIATVKDEIPFTCTIDVPGTKINMQCLCKVSLENIEADIQGNIIAIKGLVKVDARVNYIVHKEFLVDICSGEGEIPKKNASIIIYVVQNGDTLWKIAKRYHTTIDELVKINDIENCDYIKLGQKLIIPGRAVI